MLDLACRKFLLLSLLLHCVAPQASQTRQFDVFTDIDRSLMVKDTITVELDPTSVTLMFDQKNSKFFDQIFTLSILSSLDSDDDLVKNGYQLTLMQNSATCFDDINSTTANVVVGYETLATVHLDSLSNPLVLDSTHDIASFDVSGKVGKNAESEHSIILTYSVINDKSIRHCQGTFVLGFRYNI